MNYRHEIDGLRALAVVPVILFHAGFKAFSGGFIGVDVFFVISGYLITSIMLAEIQAGTFSLMNFYERRARRLLPLLFFVMAACVPFAWLLMPTDNLENFFQSLVAIPTFSSNVLFWLGSGYFDRATEFKPLLHTWSLGVEEQYYLLFPLFVMAISRLGKVRMTAVLALLMLASLGAAQWTVHYMHSATFFLLPTRGWEMLVGALTAIGFQRLSSFGSAALRQALALMGVALILTAVFVYDRQTPFPSVYALVPTLGTVLILAFAGPQTWVGTALTWRPIAGIGLISYGAYLWHQPIFVFARMRWLDEDLSTAMLLVLSALSLGLAYLTYRWIERPFRDRTRFCSKQTFEFAAAGSVFFVALGSAVLWNHSIMDARLNPAQKQLMGTAVSSPKRSACHTGGDHYKEPAQACEYFNHQATWAVLGDSHAAELAYALAEQLDPQGDGVRQLSFSGCVPSYGRTDLQTPCAQWTQKAVDDLIARKSIHTVVVSHRIHAALFGTHRDSYPGLPHDVSEKERQLRWASYIQVLEKLKQAGKRVVLVLQAPEVRRDVRDLIYAMGRGEPTIHSVPKAWWDQRSEFVHDHLRQIPAGVQIIDPQNYLCDRSYCYATYQGVAWYFDDDHMSINGAARVAAAVLARVNQGT